MSGYTFAKVGGVEDRFARSKRVLAPRHPDHLLDELADQPESVSDVARMALVALHDLGPATTVELAVVIERDERTTAQALWTLADLDLVCQRGDAPITWSAEPCYGVTYEGDTVIMDVAS
jgi:hypothetical protein